MAWRHGDILRQYEEYRGSSQLDLPAQRAVTGTEGFWAAIEKSTGAFLGWSRFRPAGGSSSDEVELGYRLRKSTWGKGYGANGSHADPRGCAGLGVQRAVAETMSANIASRRVMAKAPGYLP